MIEEEIEIIPEIYEEEIVLEEENVVVGGEGSRDYNKLYNKPQINDVELRDNQTAEQLDLQRRMRPLSNKEILDIINK